MTATGLRKPSFDERIAMLFASDPVTMADPYTLFRELREAAPLHDFGQLTLVTRYADVKARCLRPRCHSRQPMRKTCILR